MCVDRKRRALDAVVRSCFDFEARVVDVLHAAAKVSYLERTRPRLHGCVGFRKCSCGSRRARGRDRGARYTWRGRDFIDNVACGTRVQRERNNTSAGMCQNGGHRPLVSAVYSTCHDACLASCRQALTHAIIVSTRAEVWRIHAADQTMFLLTEDESSEVINTRDQRHVPESVSRRELKVVVISAEVHGAVSGARGDHVVALNTVELPHFLKGTTQSRAGGLSPRLFVVQVEEAPSAYSSRNPHGDRRNTCHMP